MVPARLFNNPLLYSVKRYVTPLCDDIQANPIQSNLFEDTKYKVVQNKRSLYTSTIVYTSWSRTTHIYNVISLVCYHQDIKTV